jgi:hypothetical protein
MPNPNDASARKPAIEKMDALQKLAHGGLIGSAHPATIRELYETEQLQRKLGKLAHGGLIGSAHPSLVDELEQPESTVKPR